MRSTPHLVRILPLLLMAGCFDAPLAPKAEEPPVPPLPEPPPLPWARASAADVVVYPRDDSTFWVYDERPEYGVGSHLWEPLDRAGMRGMNARFVRTTVMWKLWHENPVVNGVTHRQAIDYTIKHAMQDGDFEPVILIHTEPEGYDWNNREAAFEVLAQDMADMAARYPEVRYWELFNEQNIGFGTLFGQHLHDWGNKIGRWVPHYERGQIYAQMLKKVYPALKKANPNAWVIFGGVTPSYRECETCDNYHPEEVAEFIQGVYDAGGRNYFDIMNVHSYGTPLLPNFRDIGLVARRVMSAYGDQTKPIINTEFGTSAANELCESGWPTDSLAGFDRRQLEELRSTYEYADQSRLYWKVMPYQLMAESEMHWCDRAREAYQATLPDSIFWNDYSHGLMRWDRTEGRPSYDWIANFTAARQLPEGRVTDVRITYPDGTEVVRTDVPVGVRHPTVLRITR